MKNLKLKIWIFVLLLLIAPAATALWGFALPECYGDSFMGELKYKTALLDKTEGGRIVIVGGSAAAFGVDSALLEGAFPEYKTVNFGMYAALGTSVMLDLSENSIHEGDIVILMPELSHQTMSEFFDPSVMWQGLDGAFSLIYRLPADKILRLMGAFPEFAAAKLGYTLRGERPEGEGVYCRSSFNEYGDIASPLCERNIMPLLYDETSPVTLNPELASEDFIARVNDYAKRVREKGGEIYFAFAPVNALSVSGNVETLFESLRTRLSFPIIGDPKDSIMDAGWFYDTNYHLNSSGKKVYTDTLIGAIKAAEGDPEAFSISMPAMPQPENALYSEGDDTDGEYFAYLDLGEGWAVVGADDREKLTVPAHYDHRPVIAIYEGAFSECKALREVIIQKNIRSIASGAFDGAESLERIVIQNDKPSDTRAGDGLLRGTDARIYVPDSALGAYKTDYFWSVFGSRIVSE